MRQTPQIRPPRPAARPGRSPGFTLVELIVCLGIVALLCGILLPSLRSTRESACRLHCASNQRQIGVGCGAYANNHDGRLPYASMIDETLGPPQPGELMATRINTIHGGQWDGLGRLYPYLGSSCDCLYCPSHTGRNTLDRWAPEYAKDENLRIYANYHYAGHLAHWLQPRDPMHKAPLRLDMGRSIVLLSDGLRTQMDFNHKNGLNRLFGDLSVEWWADREEDPLRARLPATDSGDLQVVLDTETFQSAWASFSGSPVGN